MLYIIYKGQQILFLSDETLDPFLKEIKLNKTTLSKALKGDCSLEKYSITYVGKEPCPEA